MAEHGSYVLKVAEDTSRAIAALKTDNERLRLQLAALESDRARIQQEKLRLQDQLMTTREELARRVDEHSDLMRRVMEVERDNERVAGQFLDIETQNTNLANLYVAGYQLHGSLDRDRVLGSIREIIINLIGSEDFGVYERIGTERCLRLVSWYDTPEGIPHEVAFGEGVVGTVAETARPLIDESGRRGAIACIPLAVDGHVVGAIAIFRLLPQKSNELEPIDRELLDLLASQAGIALYSTALHADSSGRLPIRP